MQSSNDALWLVTVCDGSTSSVRLQTNLLQNLLHSYRSVSLARLWYQSLTVSDSTGHSLHTRHDVQKLVFSPHFLTSAIRRLAIMIRKWLFALTKVRIASNLFALTGVNILWSSTWGKHNTAAVSYISPQKKPSFNDKVWTYLSANRLKVKKRKKRAHPQTPPPRLRKDFFYYCDTLYFSSGVSSLAAVKPDQWHHGDTSVGISATAARTTNSNSIRQSHIQCRCANFMEQPVRWHH